MNYRTLLTLVCLIGMSASAFAFDPAQPDTTKGLLDKAQITVEMAKARTKYLEGDVRGALTIYRNVLVSDKRNASALFRMAECQHDLKNYKLALEKLEEALKIDPEVNKETDYLYGRIYHRSGELDKALEYLEKFDATLKDRQKDEFQTGLAIAQVKTAKELIAKPAPAKVTMIGRGVNSRHPDYRPVLSSDGKTLYFTARRPDTKGGMKSQYDNFYYSDIYMSKWDDAANTWGDAEKIPGKVNSEYWDAATGISPDGQYLYLTQNIPRYTGSSDLMYTKLSGSGTWGKPKLMPKPVNSSFFESSATITGDDQTMFFISERQGTGLGRGDIYSATRLSRKTWNEPVHMGAILNTEYDENSVHVHPSGKILFFSSKGHNSMGGYDIFKSELVDGRWGEPVNLGYPINTVGDDTHFCLSVDGKKAFVTSHRENGMGDYDIYEIDLSEYPILKPDMEFKTHGVVRGTVFNEDGQPVQSKVEFFVNGARKAETTSNARGEYEIELVGNLKYEIRFSAEGYQMARTEIELDLAERGDTELAKDVILKK